MSPVSAVVGRRLALGAWLAFALVGCQGPDEYFRNDGSLGRGRVTSAREASPGTAALGTAATGGSVSGLGGSIRDWRGTTGSAGVDGDRGHDGRRRDVRTRRHDGLRGHARAEAARRAARARRGRRDDADGGGTTGSGGTGRRDGDGGHRRGAAGRGGTTGAAGSAGRGGTTGDRRDAAARRARRATAAGRGDDGHRRSAAARPGPAARRRARAAPVRARACAAPDQRRARRELQRSRDRCDLSRGRGYGAGLNCGNFVCAAHVHGQWHVDQLRDGGQLSRCPRNGTVGIAWRRARASTRTRTSRRSSQVRHFVAYHDRHVADGRLSVLEGELEAHVLDGELFHDPRRLARRISTKPTMSSPSTGSPVVRRRFTNSANSARYSSVRVSAAARASDRSATTSLRRPLRCKRHWSGPGERDVDAARDGAGVERARGGRCGRLRSRDPRRHAGGQRGARAFNRCGCRGAGRRWHGSGGRSGGGDRRAARAVGKAAGASVLRRHSHPRRPARPPARTGRAPADRVRLMFAATIIAPAAAGPVSGIFPRSPSPLGAVPASVSEPSMVRSSALIPRAASALDTPTCPSASRPPGRRPARRPAGAARC